MGGLYQVMQVVGIAAGGIGIRKPLLQQAVQRRIHFNRQQAPRPDAVLQQGIGDGAGARAQFHHMARTGGHGGRHQPRQLSTRRGD